MSLQYSLEIINLSKSYDIGKYRIIGLPKVSFEMKIGDKMIIRGNNGCGKSTLLKIIAGLLKPTSGRIKYSTNSNGKDKFLKNIGYIPEQVEFDQSMTPRTFWELSKRLRGSSCEFEKFVQELEYLNMVKWIDQPIGSFSLGMKKRLLLAIWLSLNVELLLLDEFESGLDADASQLVKKIFEEKRELSILAISHNYNSPVFDSFHKVDFTNLLLGSE